jgi:selenocysteine lyase/cysteine desulfurase
VSVPRLINWNRAATSADPFPGVAEALLEGLLAPPSSRGVQGQATAERIFAIRARAARLFDFSHPSRVIFVPSCTWGLNVAVHGSIQPGQTVLTTAVEHNSVARPLEAARRRGVKVEVLPVDASGRWRIADLQARLSQGGVDWLALAVASNVLGIVQHYPEACALAQTAGVKVILDLAQGGGVLPISLDRLAVSYAAISGHKSLHGPRGIGLLFVGPEEQPEPLAYGGTGSEGALIEMPRELPQRLEAGTSNYPGIFGLGAALEHLEQHPVNLQLVRARLAELETWCRAQPGLEVLPPEPPPWSERLPVLAIRPRAVPAEVFVQFLGDAGLDARAGTMCTSRLLPGLGLSGGVVRLSPAPAAPEQEFQLVREILGNALLELA